MAFKKTEHVSRSAHMYEEEIHVEVEHVDDELHILNQVEEETQDVEDTEKDEEILDDYMLARDRPRRVIKPPQRLMYANLIAYALISASEFYTKNPKTIRKL